MTRPARRLPIFPGEEAVEGEGGEASHAVPHQHEAAGADGVHHRLQVHGELVHAVLEFRLRVGAPVPPQVHRDHLAPHGQRPLVVEEVAVTAPAVHAEDRVLTLAAHAGVHPPPVGGGHVERLAGGIRERADALRVVAAAVPPHEGLQAPRKRRRRPGPATRPSGVPCSMMPSCPLPPAPPAPLPATSLLLSAAAGVHQKTCLKNLASSALNSSPASSRQQCPASG